MILSLTTTLVVLLLLLLLFWWVKLWWWWWWWSWTPEELLLRGNERNFLSLVSILLMIWWWCWWWWWSIEEISLQVFPPNPNIVMFKIVRTLKEKVIYLSLSIESKYILLYNKDIIRPVLLSPQSLLFGKKKTAYNCLERVLPEMKLSSEW